MEKCEGLKVVLGSKYVDATRAIKDEKEIECMIENSQINDVVMERTRDFISEGMTEKQVEAFILEQYKLLGCQKFLFHQFVHLEQMVPILTTCQMILY